MCKLRLSAHQGSLLISKFDEVYCHYRTWIFDGPKVTKVLTVSACLGIPIFFSRKLSFEFSQGLN